MKIKQIIKFIILLSIISFFSINIVYGCKYKSEIDQCIDANFVGMNKSINDFVCRVGTYEEIIYQVILDKEFKIIDDEMDLYLEKLETNKNYYFGVAKKKNFLEGINDITDKRKYFRKKYLDLCGGVINEEAIECTEDKKVSNQNIKDYFKTTECESLVNVKLDIFHNVAVSILMLNKEQIASDDKKIYDQGQRRNYDLVLDIMMINLGYLERIWQKWPTKLANTK